MSFAIDFWRSINEVNMMSKSVALCLTLIVAANGTYAAAIVGGSSLLTGSYANQLESWLGEGPITLTNVYTKQDGDTAYNFHGASDHRGRTFVVMYATENDGNSAVIGGFNLLSWDAVAGWDYVSPHGDNTDNFLFNLTTSTKWAQLGPRITYNDLHYGPTFGDGFDLYVDDSLSMGYSNGHTYGVYQGTSLVDGSLYDGTNMRIDGMEVFTITDGVSNDVPEPMSLALVGAALAAAATGGRRRG